MSSTPGARARSSVSWSRTTVTLGKTTVAVGKTSVTRGDTTSTLTTLTFSHGAKSVSVVKTVLIRGKETHSNVYWDFHT
ncbi:unnamed protein product [Arctogadus glacialis]